MSTTTSISKKRLETILILFFFTLLAILNTFLRDQFNPVSGWPGLICFTIFSFYYIFKKEFDRNSEKIILVIILILASFSIFLYFYIEGQIFGLNEFGQSILQIRIRDDWFLRRNLPDYIPLWYNKNYIAQYFFWTTFFILLYRIHKNKLDYLNIILFIIMISVTALLASGKLFVVSIINFITYIYLLQIYQKRTFYLLLAFLSIFFMASFVLLIIFNVIFVDRLMELVSDKFTSLILTNEKGRIFLIYEGIKLIGDNIFGSGLYYSRDNLYTYTHNNYVETFIAIGPFFSLLFYIYIFLKFKKYYKVFHIKIIFNTIFFLSFFQAIYSALFILQMVLCFISCYENKNEIKKN
jgi:hypothetical protein